jgi:hypothetical protein
MGSKSSKWLAAALAATALAVVPAGAFANLDYSKNSVSGQYLPTTQTPAPVKPVAPVSHSDSRFAWGAALAVGGIALLLAFGGIAIVRRRHPSPLAS